MICFIDMDGVIANFVKGVCAAHKLPSPYHDPKSLGIFDIDKLWGMTPQKLWEPCEGETFWDNLEKTPEADSIVSLAVDTYGQDNVAILTAPSMSPYCVPGKRRWMKKHFPTLAKSMIFSSAKKFLAGPKRILIDDRNENIDAFRSYGGFGVMVPRPWNRMHDYNGSVIEFLKYKLEINK